MVERGAANDKIDPHLRQEISSPSTILMLQPRTPGLEAQDSGQASPILGPKSVSEEGIDGTGVLSPTSDSWAVFSSLSPRKTMTRTGLSSIFKSDFGCPREHVQQEVCRIWEDCRIALLSVDRELPFRNRSRIFGRSRTKENETGHTVEFYANDAITRGILIFVCCLNLMTIFDRGGLVVLCKVMHHSVEPLLSC